MAPSAPSKSISELFALRTQILALVRSESSTRSSITSLAKQLISGASSLQTLIEEEAEKDEEEGEDRDITDEELLRLTALGIKDEDQWTEHVKHAVVPLLRGWGYYELSCAGPEEEEEEEGPPTKKRRMDSGKGKGEEEEEETDGLALLGKALKDYEAAMDVINEDPDSSMIVVVLASTILKANCEMAATLFLNEDKDAIKFATTTLSEASGRLESVAEAFSDASAEDLKLFIDWAVDPMGIFVEAVGAVLMVLDAVESVSKFRNKEEPLAQIMECIKEAANVPTAYESEDAVIANKWRLQIAVLRADVDSNKAGWKMEDWEAGKKSEEVAKKTLEAVETSIESLKAAIEVVKTVTGTSGGPIEKEELEKLCEAYQQAIKLANPGSEKKKAFIVELAEIEADLE
ncbi:hypothetical protein P7C70_g5271, partial [Phenoliferia sp. Uapishka_3]